MNKTPIIIDTDPGIDDAVALAIALFSDQLDVKLITTVAGNVSLDKVTYNTLRLMKYFGKKVPVAAGSSHPLLAPFTDASDVHGETGLEGFEFEGTADDLLLHEHAINAMHRVINETEDPMTIVAIGPLTNIALLIRVYPEVKSKIREIVLMGGAIGQGNKGVYSEFNLATDPEAGKIVFESGIPIVVSPMDLGVKTMLVPENASKLENLNKTGEMLYALFSTHRKNSMKNGLKMYDSCAIAYLLKPELFTTENVYIAVDVQSPLTAGATLVDFKGYLKQPANATICTDVNQQEFTDWFFEALSKCI